MDKVEQYFEDHREGFDFLQPEENSWKAIAQQLDRPRPAPKIKWWRRYGVAAALFLLCIITGLSYFINQSESEVVAGLEINDYFPDVVLRDPDGKPIPLSSMKGKIVLVEFWASYSKVCTDQHCFYFKPLYEEYREKGFEIYAISVDSSASEWIDAIQHDQLDWVQVSDLDGTQSAAVQAFSLNKLPMTFLLNEDGKILAKDIDAEQLQDKLHQLFAYN